MPHSVLKLAPADNVVVALRDLTAGEAFTLDGATVVLTRDIAVGHKIAAGTIAAGERIFKYNCPIGRATRAIAAGEYVHTHNVASDYLPTYMLP